MEDGNIIKHMKVFSLLVQNKLNSPLVKDLVKFLDENLKTHSTITWEAMKKNPAVSQYNKVSKMFGLNITENSKNPKDNFKEIKHPDNNKKHLYVLKKELYTPEHQKAVEQFLTRK
jgi:hypothetical protein